MLDYADLKKKKSQWPKTTVLFDTLPVSHRSQGGVLFTGITQNRADGVTTISNTVSFQWQRAREFLNFLALAVNYSGQEKTHGTSVHSALARTSHLAPM